MTAPLTPRDNQPPEEPQRPFAAPAHPSPDHHPSSRRFAPHRSPEGYSADPRGHTSHGPAGDGGGPDDVQDDVPDHRPDHVRELREAAVIALAVAVSGALLGLLWVWLAPHVPLVSDGKSVFLKNTEGEEAIAADGWFVLLAAGFGVLSAAVVFLFRRRGGIPLVVALVVGGLLGAVLAWRLGVWLGPTEDLVARAKQVGPGVPFDSPLRLDTMGALLAWPIASMIAQLLLTGFFGPHDPEPPAPIVPDWSGHHQDQYPHEQQHPPRPE